MGQTLNPPGIIDDRRTLMCSPSSSFCSRNSVSLKREGYFGVLLSSERAEFLAEKTELVSSRLGIGELSMAKQILCRQKRRQDGKLLVDYISVDTTCSCGFANLGVY
jgi:hypothetical protein